MRLHLILAVSVLALLVSGCASTNVPPVRKANEPFPGPISFSGDFDRAPTMRFMPRTVFPPFLIRKGESGTATIAFQVKADGYVEQAKVESATNPAFGASALGTVGRMVFVPAKKGAAAVAATGHVTFPFTFE